MTKFQTTIHALRDEIATGIVEDAADQPEVRWTVKPDGNAFAVEFEARIVNPDQGYESDWSWQDRIILTARGRRIA